MKFLSKFVLLIILFVGSLSMIMQKRNRIIFFGDSITQAGVDSGGYITKIARMLNIKNLAGQYELMGAGIGGNKVYDLYLRVDEDVLAKNPDVVVIWVGVNDVWHKSSHGTGTDADKFQRFYEALIRKFQAKNIKIFLVTPAAIGEKTDNSNQQDGDLNSYSNIIRKLAVTMNCRLIDLRKLFLEYNLKNNPENKDFGILTTDRVHLNEKGNQFVAEKMLEALLQDK